MAAGNIRDIKRRIKSVTSTEHITNAMKLVSAGKLRKAKAIFEKTSESFNNSKDIPEEYLEGTREIKKTCYIVVTSSRGLCGGFNSSILKEAQSMIDMSGSESVILAIGMKAKEYFEKRGYEIFSHYLAPPENISFLEAREMALPLLDLYTKGEIDEIQLVYTSFISSMEQQVRTARLLPFDVEHDPEVIRNAKTVEYEPSVEAVFNYLVPKYVEMMLYAAVVESATCEHAARRMAMENATDSAREMLDVLSLTYNRARQSAITDEIIEIVAGSEAQN